MSKLGKFSPAPSELKGLIKKHAKQIDSKIEYLKKQQSKLIDASFQNMHDLVFQELSCLDCANCCKTISPIFKQKDIDTIAKRLNLKAGVFITKYLYMDEDGDFVLQSTPCPFLEKNNKCSIYEDRPKACREYPHTNQKKMLKHIDLLKENIKVCPATYKIVEQI